MFKLFRNAKKSDVCQLNNDRHVIKISNYSKYIKYNKYRIINAKVVIED